MFDLEDSFPGLSAWRNSLEGYLEQVPKSRAYEYLLKKMILASQKKKNLIALGNKLCSVFCKGCLILF